MERVHEMDRAAHAEPTSPHSLYLFTFDNGKRYVGQTVRALSTRLNAHRTAANRGSDLPVHAAWRKHGEPAVDVLGWFDTHEELHRAEISAIAILGTQSPGGYNVSVGGDTAPSRNPEVAKKIAAKATGRKIADTSSISEAVRRRWKDPEGRAKMVEGARKAWTEEMRAAAGDRSRQRWAQRRAEGWSMPEATKEKMRHKVVTDEARANMSAAAKGKVISDATRQKMSAANAGRKYGPQSEQRRANISAGIRAAAQRRKEKTMEPTS